jgi:hypothetical protein
VCFKGGCISNVSGVRLMGCLLFWMSFHFTYDCKRNWMLVVRDGDIFLFVAVSFATHNARTLIPMNTRTQTLPLGAFSKTVPSNPQD